MANFPVVPGIGLPIREFKPALASCNRQYLLKNSKFLSDVRFIVGQSGKQHTFFGHKAIFAVASEVFWAMFQSEIGPRYDVSLPDVDPDAFDLFMDDLYHGDKVGILLTPRVEGADWIEQIEDILDLNYIAHQYMVIDLRTRCSKALEEIMAIRLTPDSVLGLWTRFVLPKAMLQCESVAALIERYLDSNAQEAMTTEEFYELTQTQLTNLLTRDSLQVVRELNVFEACVRWAKRQCENLGIEVSWVNAREQLGPALYQIRLLNMDFYTFTMNVCTTGILNAGDIGKIINAMVQRLAVPPNFQPPAVHWGECPFNVAPRTSATDCLDNAVAKILIPSQGQGAGPSSSGIHRPIPLPAPGAAVGPPQSGNSAGYSILVGAPPSVDVRYSGRLYGHGLNWSPPFCHHPMQQPPPAHMQRTQQNRNLGPVQNWPIEVWPIQHSPEHLRQIRHAPHGRGPCPLMANLQPLAQPPQQPAVPAAQAPAVPPAAGPPAQPAVALPVGPVQEPQGVARLRLRRGFRGELRAWLREVVEDIVEADRAQEFAVVEAERVDESSSDESEEMDADVQEVEPNQQP